MTETVALRVIEGLALCVVLAVVEIVCFGDIELVIEMVPVLLTDVLEVCVTMTVADSDCCNDIEGVNDDFGDDETDGEPVPEVVLFSVDDTVVVGV